MDIIAKIDRTLLDAELRNLVRFLVFRESDKVLFNPTYKINTLYELCVKDSKNYNYEEGTYNYEKYVKQI